MEKNELTEVRKKSHMNCKSAFELQKLLGESCFIRFSYEEKQEEFCFTYDLSGLKSVPSANPYYVILGNKYLKAVLISRPSYNSRADTVGGSAS